MQIYLDSTFLRSDTVNVGKDKTIADLKQFGTLFDRSVLGAQ